MESIHGRDEICLLDKFSDFAMQLDIFRSNMGHICCRCRQLSGIPTAKIPTQQSLMSEGANYHACRQCARRECWLHLAIDHPSTGARRGGTITFLT